MEYKKIGFSEDDIEQITSELADSRLTIKVALKSGTTLSTAPITLSSKDTKPTSVSANIANNKLTITVALSDGTQISSIPVEIVKPTSVTTEYSNKTLSVKLGLSDGTTLQDTAIVTDLETTEDLTAESTWISGGALTEFGQNVRNFLEEGLVELSSTLPSGQKQNAKVIYFGNAVHEAEIGEYDFSFIVGSAICGIVNVFNPGTGTWTPTFFVKEVGDLQITQETGQNADKVMSQKAVTDAINNAITNTLNTEV